jgi:hypothetical protein
MTDNAALCFACFILTASLALVVDVVRVFLR